jgi:3-hydroxyacyl-[acyl-carrier-protein] dehydratase
LHYDPLGEASFGVINETTNTMIELVPGVAYEVNDVLQIEALAQALCILIAESFPEASAGKRPAFAGIEDVRFRRAVRPGDVLELNVELVQFRRGFATANAYASVGGEKAAEAMLKATMV